jgi:hypothetical protein
LTWPAISGATLYYVQKGPGGGALTYYATVRASTESLIVAHLTPGTSYDFKVIAASASLTSPPSTTVHVSTAAGPATPAVTLDGETSSSIRLTWTPAAAPGAVHYYVYQAAGATPDPASYVFKGSTTGTTLTAVGLAPLTIYSYLVYAVDSGNTSSVSEVATTTTSAGPS